MAATTSQLMTVEEFRRLPQDNGPVYHELRHGELVAETRPKFKHSLIQHTVRRLFEDVAEPTSFVDIEVPFRPLPEHELWTADVAYLSSWVPTEIVLYVRFRTGLTGSISSTCTRQSKNRPVSGA
jgi:hypothetical protein